MIDSYSDDQIVNPWINDPHIGDMGGGHARQPLDSNCALHRIIQRLGSQAELARRLGMNRSQASTVRWWVTKGRVPAKWIHRVAAVGGVKVSELVSDWPHRSPPAVNHGKN